MSTRRTGRSTVTVAAFLREKGEGGRGTGKGKGRVRKGLWPGQTRHSLTFLFTAYDRSVHRWITAFSHESLYAGMLFCASVIIIS